MFPTHCSSVSTKRVSFPLTEDDINNNLLNKPAYKKTEYIILNNGNDWAVVSVNKADAINLFTRITAVEVISLPDSTKYLEDRSIDVLSPTRMAEKAQELDTETLVVKGMFEHVSFIHKEKLLPLMVFEVVPPEPPKLTELVRGALNSGNVSKPVRIMPKIMDLRVIADNCTSQNIVFPCRASGLTSDKKTFYLDQRPEISSEEKSSISLIGCDLSLRIFNTLYDVEPEFFNFCPKRQAMDLQSELTIITKCCEVKQGYTRIGNIVIVPWGATQREVEDALNDLLGNTRYHDTHDE